jgi:hypothetical protein
MNSLTVALSSIVAVSGLGCGVALAYIAPEELKDGKKYFIALQKIIASLIIYFFLRLFGIHYLISAIAVLVFFLSHWYSNTEKIKYYSEITYGIFALILFAAQKNANYFFLTAILIFLYGFPTGSIEMQKKKGAIVRLIKPATVFIAMMVLLIIAI